MPELRRSNRVAKSQPVSYASESETDEPPQKRTKTQAKKEIDADENEEVEEESSLELGDSIPSVTLKDENNNDVTLSEIKNYLVLFAYPKASTPGCTRQVNGFEKNFEYYKKNNISIYGISSDTPENQLKFKNKYNLTYSLLSDPEKLLIAPLGAKKSPSGIKRSHWIFKDGKLIVKKLTISPEVSVDSALSDIEEFLKENNGKNGNDDSVKEESAVKEDPVDDTKTETREEAKDQVDVAGDDAANEKSNEVAEDKSFKPAEPITEAV